MADLLGASPNSINGWYKDGLMRIDDHKPYAVFGENLINFLKDKNNKRKQKCAPSEFYCCKCKTPRGVWGNVIDIEYIAPKRLLLTGLCNTCETKMYKIASVTIVEEVKKIFDIQVVRKKEL